MHFTFQIKGLRNEVYPCTISPLTATEFVHRIPNAGLPISSSKTYKDANSPLPTERGCIIVHFQIDLPTVALDKTAASALEHLLPNGKINQSLPPLPLSKSKPTITHL